MTGILLLYVVAACLLFTFLPLGLGLASEDPQVLEPQSAALGWSLQNSMGRF